MKAAMHAGRVVSFSHRPGKMAAEKRAYCVVDDSCIFARFSQMLIQEDDLATLGGSLSGLVRSRNILNGRAFSLDLGMQILYRM